MSNINFKDNIIDINELSNNRIGILFKNKLSIYSSHSFKEINSIQPNEEQKNDN